MRRGLGLDAKGMLDPVELLRAVVHEDRPLGDHLLILEEEHVHVDALRVALHAHAAPYELLQLDLVRPVHVEKHEERPRLRDVQLQRLEVGLDAVLPQVRLELLQGQHARLVLVGLVEERLDVLHVLPVALNLALHNIVSVPPRDLGRTIDESANYNVEHAKYDEEHVEHEGGTVDPVQAKQRHAKLHPVHSAANGREERQQRVQQGAKLRYQRVRLRVARGGILLEVLRYAVHEEDGEEVHDEEQQREHPEQGRERVQDRVDHQAERLEEAHDPDDAQDACEAQDPQRPGKRYVGKRAFGLVHRDVDNRLDNEGRVKHVPLPVRADPKYKPFGICSEKQLNREDGREDDLNGAPHGHVGWVALVLDGGDKGGVHLHTYEHRVQEDQKGASKHKHPAVDDPVQLIRMRSVSLKVLVTGANPSEGVGQVVELNHVPPLHRLDTATCHLDQPLRPRPLAGHGPARVHLLHRPRARAQPPSGGPGGQSSVNLRRQERIDVG
mmetsp:Transcript_112621/g.318599  ORF Transcript_112621/g.318599 Transcript_112621/m.318599 type:complete len:498 (+) Transcript_112621:241-1734(+)